MAEALNERLVELRGDVSEFHISIIDAVIKANPGWNRGKVLRDIVREYCERKINEAMLVQRMLPRNGNAVRSEWDLNSSSTGN